MEVGRLILRNVRDFSFGYTDVQIQVRHATSNKEAMPTASVMNDIAGATFHERLFTEVMSIIKRRLNDHGKNWRHVYKSLLILEHCIQFGSNQVADYATRNLQLVKTLRHFQYVDSNGKDQGAAVRQKSMDIVALLGEQNFIDAAPSNRCFSDQSRSSEELRRPRSSHNASFSINGGLNDEEAFRRAIDESRREPLHRSASSLHRGRSDFNQSLQGAPQSYRPPPQIDEPSDSDSDYEMPEASARDVISQNNHAATKLLGSGSFPGQLKSLPPSSAHSGNYTNGSRYRSDSDLALGRQQQSQSANYLNGHLLRESSEERRDPSRLQDFSGAFSDREYKAVQQYNHPPQQHPALNHSNPSISQHNGFYPNHPSHTNYSSGTISNGLVSHHLPAPEQFAAPYSSQPSFASHQLALDYRSHVFPNPADRYSSFGEKPALFSDFNADHPNSSAGSFIAPPSQSGVSDPFADGSYAGASGDWFPSINSANSISPNQRNVQRNISSETNSFHNQHLERSRSLTKFS